MMRATPLFWALAAVLVAGCAPQTPKTFSPDVLETLYEPRYAEGFGLYRWGNSAVLHVRKPWQEAKGDGLWYFLAREGEEAPEGFPGERLTVPLERIVAMSSSYVAFLDTLGRDTAVKGVSGGRFLTSPRIRERLERNEVRDVGYEGGLDYEALTALRPDAMLVYGVEGENDAVTDKVKELGVKAMYIGDYLENDPLGRAEWLVVFGELVGEREKAERMFGETARAYEAAKALAAKAGTRPEVMLNAPWRDVWFVPGDRSYMVRLLRDAGAEYVCRGEDTDRSRPIGAEAAYVFASRADFWLNPGSANSLAEVAAGNPNFRQVPAFRTGRVYNNNARQTPMGGSDFWESGVAAPDVVLKDLIRIFHPELLPNHEPYYFKKLE